MHDSFLFAFSFLFSRQDIGIYPPQKFSREVSFFSSFIMYLGGLQVYG